MKTPNSIKDIVTGRSSLENWLKKNYEEFYEYLSNNYSWTNDYKAKVYCYYNNINEQPKCELCGKSTKFQSTGYGYARFCSTKCSRNSETSQERYKQTNIERYGEDYAKVTNSKGTQTKIKKYGSASYNNLEKRKQTCLDKFGVDNPMKLADIQHKVRRTMLERYGYEYNFLDPNMRKKMKEKPIRHYKDVIKVLDNGDFVCSCPDPNCNLCQEKQYEISYRNYYNRKFCYKVDLCTKRSPIGQLPNSTNNTNIEKFVKEILDENSIEYITNTRRVIIPLELDIYIPSKKIAIECNGRYWHSIDSVGCDYHKNKYNRCLEKNINLLSIWDDQIKNNPELIKYIILNYVGLLKYELITIREDYDMIRVYYDGNRVNNIRVEKDGEEIKLTIDNDIYVYNIINNILKKHNYYKMTIYTYNDICRYDIYKSLGFIKAAHIDNVWYYKNFNRYNERIEDSIEIQDSGITKWIYENKI